MDQPIYRFRSIARAVLNNYYSDLGTVCLLEDSSLELMKIKVTPREGIHANLEYIVTITFKEAGTWPIVHIDSPIFDRIKTNQYLKNRGKVGEHKGICIKNLSYGYNSTYSKHFKELCANKWENYLYHLIITFNNIQDFERGNGFKSNYKQILSLSDSP